MILANAIVFLAVIVIVCAVDLSTLSLDESTERLLYLGQDNEGSGVEEAGQTEAPADSTQNPPLDIDTEGSDESGDNMDEKIKDALSSMEDLIDGEIMGYEGDSVQTEEDSARPTDPVAELLKQKSMKDNGGQKAADSPGVVVPEELLGNAVTYDDTDDIGMSADFGDNFEEVQELMRSIHNGGE